MTIRSSMQERSRSRVIIAALAALLATGGCQYASHQTQRLEAEKKWAGLRVDLKLRLADQQMENGRVREASSTLAEAAAVDPTDSSPLRTLATCYLELGELSEAQRAVDRAAALGDRSAELAYTQGMIAEQRSHFDEALERFLTASKTDPDNSDYPSAAAECLVTMGRSAEARTFVDEQLQRRPNDRRLRLLRAHICLLLDDTEQAVADFEQAEIGLEPDSVGAGEFGLALVRAGRYAKALAILQPMVDGFAATANEEIDDSSPSPRILRALAECRMRVGHLQAAHTLLLARVRQAPDDGRAWWLLTECNMQLDDWDAVRDCLGNGEALGTGQTNWRLLRAYLALNDGDVDAAVELLRTILRDRPDHTLARGLLGQVYEEKAEFVLACDQYRSVLELDPQADWARARLDLALRCTEP